MNAPQLPKDDAELLQRVQTEYATQDNFPGLIRFRAVELSHVLGDLVQMGKKRILDIACGSVTSPEQQGRMYEPWFARIAHEAGATVTGIDIGDLQGEKFHGIRADLSHPRAVLAQFPPEEFDLVNTDAFIDSQNLPQASKELVRTKTDAEILAIEAELRAEVERLLKEGGIYLFNKHIAVKENGVLTNKGSIIGYKP